MATTTQTSTPSPWRSATALPVRPAVAWTPPYDTSVGRIPMTAPRPSAPGAYWPRAFAGEVVPFSITAFREGHDIIGVHLRLTSPTGDESLHRLVCVDKGLDRWQCEVVLDETGTWEYRFEAFGDDFATWHHAAHIKIPVGIDTAVMRETGALLCDRAVAERSRPSAERKMLAAAAARLRNDEVDDDAIMPLVDDHTLAAAFATRPLQSLVTLSEPQRMLVERARAGVGAWYEFFPRSEGAQQDQDGHIRSGTFRTAMKRLPAVADMGFDVVYLPPIHPIGRINRKGKNNTLTTVDGDPGSPWAIGSTEGGHDSIHPDLGKPSDFRAFVKEARRLKLEIALDLALQTAPDHPWVAAHPEWFTTLPDGSIAYAENPPKKYQDIYPLNFDNDPTGLSAEVLRVVRHWISQGVRIFRVDNPHTKPLQFWEWLISTVNAEEPDIIFLAEAFSRPAVMQSLAAAGFQQSYSYFTWRNTKSELEEFLTSVSQDTADFMRPNLFVNTPDILTEYLQYGGRAAYKIRAAIAATAAPSYGVYAGYELYENVARAGAEENLDNEKYEYKLRDWAGSEARGESLAPYLRRLNEIRRSHPALGQLRNFTAHWSDDEAIMVFSKHLRAELSTEGRPDTIIVVVNVDPHSTRQTTVHLDTRVWGVTPGDAFDVEDLITGEQWTWSDHNFVRLDAFSEPVHILHVKESA